MSGNFLPVNSPGSLGSGSLGRSEMEVEGDTKSDSTGSTPGKRLDVDYDSLLLAVYGVIQGLSTDERPEVNVVKLSFKFNPELIFKMLIYHHRVHVYTSLVTCRSILSFRCFYVITRFCS